MKYFLSIRQFSAAFFLLLFSFCITPKRFLHDMLANHKDAQISISHHYEQIAASGFHCNLDELVVVAPFLPGIQTTVPVILSFTCIHFAEPLHSFVYSYLGQTDGRGPPTTFCS